MKHPPELKYYSFYDCPFPVRSYACRQYGDAFIEFFLRQVQVCVHGWLCQNCCFHYRGQLTYNYPTSLWRFAPLLPQTVVQYFRQTGPEVVRASPCAMMWKFFYGPVSAVTTACREPLCVNIPHLIPITSGPESEPDSPWRFMEVCEHGEDCRLCCWEWLRNDPRHPHFRIAWLDGTASYTRLLPVFIWHYANGLDKRLWRTVFPRNACGNRTCCNPHHIVLKPRQAILAEARAKQLQTLARKKAARLRR